MKENHEPIPETARNPGYSQEIATKNSPELPENNQKFDAEAEKKFYKK